MRMVTFIFIRKTLIFLVVVVVVVVAGVVVVVVVVRTGPPGPAALGRTTDSMTTLTTAKCQNAKLIEGLGFRV